MRCGSCELPFLLQAGAWVGMAGKDSVTRLDLPHCILATMKLNCCLLLHA